MSIRSKGIAFLVVQAIAASAAAQTVVISEFRAYGPNGAADEFIELFNADSTAVDVGGWQVWGSSDCGMTTSLRAAIPVGTVMQARTYLLMTNRSTSGGPYSGTVAGDVTYTTGISAGGGIALRKADQTIVDQVGMCGSTAYREGTNLAAFPSVKKDQSYERKVAACGPDQDTGDNATDFAYNDGTSNPQNSKSCRPVCAGDECIVPFDPVCKDASTSTTYASPGMCVSGTCTYAPTDNTCAWGCDAATGECKADPCAGVTCTTPGVCRTLPGTCSGGTCTYTPIPTGTACDDGDACTTADKCNADGACAGTAVSCLTPGKCEDSPGTCSGGTCAYPPKSPGATCDDADACTLDDQCDALGMCAGTPKVCNTPPGPSCSDADTKVVYSGGACLGGGCLYTETPEHCANGCDMATGLCKDDPCAGVTCTTPPNPQCWNSPGQCSGGTCSYDKKAVDTTCTDGDPCTAGDKCDAAGTCVPGPAIVCPPRATACVSGASVVYTNPRCDSADGMCKYDEASTPCAFGCDPATGLCNADPCAGVTCNQPPVPQCYEAAGTCSGGQCSYTPRATGTLCDDGNPCTESDSCGADHLCAGTAMACPLPEPFCEADTVSKIAVDGGCEVADGQCHYQYRQVVCVAGCDVATGLCPGGVLISQFRVRGPAGGNDEFVELYNAGTAAAVIGGWKLNGSNNAGSVGTRATVPAGTSIGPRSFYLLANAGSSGYSGTVAADHTYTTGVTDDGGLALLDSTGAIVDQVGLSAGSAYKEGTPLAKMTGTADQSYLRATLDCGPDQDFGDNVADFSLGAATPRNSKSCRPACAGDGCVGNPPATCVDAGTSKAYPSGVCETGACTYPEVTTACDWGCDAASGLCKPDPCAGKTCDTPPATGCWEAAGTCVAGECVYTPKGVVACDDGDACTLGDMCDAAGACAGTVMTCDTPPAGDCWVASGACEAGACVYPGKPETVGCDDGDACTSDDHCDGLGACAGTMDPCDPPPPFCMTGADVSVVPMAGTCTDGQCMWPTTEVPCPWGCDDDTGSCVPDPCLTGTCVTPPGPCYQPTGTCVDGKCVYQALAQGDPCDDGDWCTDPDTCGANLECHGTAVVCAPLDPACLDDDTSVTFTGGTCDPAQGGQCVYDKHETTCDHGCDAATGLCEDDPCATVTCDAPPSTCHRSPGTCADGECSYSLKPATSSCDDGDECTVLDACDADGKCAGEAKACETPPDPECVDGKSRGYSPKGTCGAGGTCTYAFADTACASGCDEASGLCVGDACIGKTCDAPPGPCHVATGTCFNGKCSYLPRDAGFACDDGDPCTADSACDGAGTCVGGTAVPECQPEPVADAAEPVPEPTPDGAAEAGPEAAEPSPDVHITWDYVPSEVAAEAGPDAGGGEGGGGNCAAGPDGQGAAWLLALVALAVLRRRTFAARA